MDVAAGTTDVDLTPYDRWDTFPPDQGRILLRASAYPTLALTGDFRVVLSYTPGEGYLRAWAISTYAANGIPFVPRRGDEPPGDPTASREDAAAVGVPEPGALTLWAGDLLLEVRDLRETDAPVDPRALYARLVGMGLSVVALQTMVFVLALEETELELSRNEVRSVDLTDYVQAYGILPAWDQRCALAYVLQDQEASVLETLRRDVLRAPAGPALSIRHIAQATALAWLQGDVGLSQGYLDDPDHLARESRAWREGPRPGDVSGDAHVTSRRDRGARGA